MANFSLSGELDIRISKFQRQLAVASSKAESFSKDLSASLNGNDYFAPIKTQAKAITKDMRQIFGGIVFAQGFYRTLDALKQCVSAVWDYTNALNNANVAFSNLFSNAELGEEFVAVLQDYAARSPFDFTDVKDAATQLAAYGIESKNLMFVMEGIGNLASITGDYALTFERVSRAIGQINAKGSLKGEEMRQLAEAGLNVKDVYAKLGTSAETLANDNINAADAINAIIDVMNSRYAGALEAANTTVQGLLANLKDVALMVTSSIIQPLYQGVQKYLGKAVDKLSKFQSIFRETNLRNAILQVFGPEVLAKIENMANTIWRIVTIIRSALYPAIQLFSYFGSACSTAFNLILTYVGPVIMVFNSLLTALLKTEAGANLLRTSMALLVAYFIATKVHAIGMMIVTVVSKAFAVLSFIVKAASASLSLFSVSALRTSGALAICKSAWLQFCASLNVHPIVLAITIILTLIATIIGLKTALSGMFTGLGDWSQLGTEQFLADVQSGSGDISKFNKRLSDTNTGLEDLQDNLEGSGDSAKKAAEGLLSFDEVFSIPENNDTATDTGQLGDIGDIEPIEIPSPEFNWELPEVQDMFGDWWQSVLDWFKTLQWPDWASIAAAGILPFLREILANLRKVFTRAATQVPRALLPWNTAIKGYLPKAVEEALADSEKESIEKVSTKLPESLKKGAVQAAEKTTFSDFVTKIIEKLKLLPRSISEKVASLDFSNVGKSILERLGISIGDVSFKELIVSFASKLKQAFSGANLVAALKEGTLIAGASLIFEYILDTFKEEIANVLNINNESFSSFVDTFGDKLSLGLATGLLTKGSWKTKLKAAGIMVALDSLFEAIAEIFEEGSFSEASQKAQTAVSAWIAAAISGIQSAGAGRGFKIGKFNIGAIIGSMFVDPICQSFADQFAEPGQSDTVRDQASNMMYKAIEGMSWGSLAGPIGAFAGGVIGLFAATFDDLSATQTVFNAVDKALVHPIMRAVSDALATFGYMAEGIWYVASTGKWSELPDLLAGKLTFTNSLGEQVTLEGRKLSQAYIWGVTSEEENAKIEAMRISDATGMGLEEASNFIGPVAYDKGKSVTEVYNSAMANEATNTADKAGIIKEEVKLGLTPTQEEKKDIEHISEDVMLDYTEGLNTGKKNLLDNFFEGVSGFWTWLVNLFTPEKAYADEIDTQGQETMSNFKSGLNKEYESSNGVSGFFKALPGKIKEFFNSAKDWLVDKGSNILSGLKSGVDTGWTNAKTFFTNLPSTVQNFFNNASSWLTEKGRNVMSGLKSGIDNTWSGTQSWFQGVGGNVQGFFSGAGNWLHSAGNNVMNGLSTGINNMWGSINNFFWQIPNTIMNCFSNAGNWLWNAGYNILTGLYNGLVNAWDSVSSFISGIGNWIVRNKGPEEYDKKLLIPAGQWIMESLLTGLENRWDDVKDLVQSVGPEIADELSSTGDDGALADGMASALSATDSVFTPIIDAIKSKFTNLNSWFYTLGESLVDSLCSGMESRLADMLTSIGIPATYLSGLTSFNSSITPTAALATPTVQVVPQQVKETPSTSYDDSSNRPILYVGTLIADKQGIRKLKQELDVIELENNRWK